MNATKTLSIEKRPAPIDWENVRARLEQARVGLTRETDFSLEEQQRILKARASALAQEPRETNAGEQGLEVVEFLLCHERYGIESCWVREVYPLKEYAPLPCTPAFVLGIINVRGKILSVIDLRHFFELPEKDLNALSKVIILQGADMEFGIQADAVLGVNLILPEELHAELPTLTGIREAYLKGVTRERLAILDGGKLLADENLIVNEEAN